MKNKFLFCYGSNNQAQLEKRLGRDVQTVPAYLNGYSRVFVGHSRNWNGAVASLVKKANKTVYGLCALVDDDDLEVMDGYEGASYERKNIKMSILMNGKEQKITAIAYIADGLEEGIPSKSYLEACAKTVSTFWSSEEGKAVTWKDFDHKGK